MLTAEMTPLSRATEDRRDHLRRSLVFMKFRYSEFDWISVPSVSVSVGFSLIGPRQWQ